MFGQENVQMPIEALRAHFWEVSSARPAAPYETPFMEIRYDQQMTDDEVAGLMGMTLEDYRAMEEGRVRVAPEDLLCFCEVMECHPLDLYAEPWGGVPLPREIFEALLYLLEDQSYAEQNRIRAYDRLAWEHHQAWTILDNNSDDLMPLYAALNNFENSDVFSRFFNSVPGAIFGQGDGQPRHVIESCLNAQELYLENEAILHADAFSGFSQRMGRNKNVMDGIAAELFGDTEKDSALERLSRLIPSDPKAQEGVKDMFIDNPSMAGRLTPHYQHCHRTGGEEAEELYLKARLLFKAATLYQQDQAIEEAGDLRAAHQNTHRQWEKFRAWRRNPQTLRLLDWLENRAVLDNQRDKITASMAVYASRNPFLP